MIQRFQGEPAASIDWANSGALPVSTRVTTSSESVCEREVVEEHTATAPSSRLRIAFCIQSLVTSTPIFILDTILTVSCLLIASFISNSLRGYYSYSLSVWNQVPALLFFQWFMFLIHHQYPGVGNSPVIELRGIARSTGSALVCVSSLNLLFGKLLKVEFFTFFLCWGLICLVIPLGRTALRYCLSKTSWWGIRAIMFGTLDHCEDISDSLSRRPVAGYNFVGCVAQSSDDRRDRIAPQTQFQVNFESNETRNGGFLAFGDVELAVKTARELQAPVVCVVTDRTLLARSERLLFRIPAVIWLNTAQVDGERIEASGLPGLVINRVSSASLSYLAQTTKRFTDILVSMVLLTLLAVPFLLIGIAIKLISQGPVFYGSERIGQHGKRFKMWKFRTMVPNADKVIEEHIKNNPDLRLEWETESKLRYDPRIIPHLGQRLRSWSVDELPQLWNVLIGQMSLVGPRPMLPSEVTKYGESYYQYTLMTPGITGLWQVSGRSDTTFRRRVFLVHQYASNWSFWLDVWILLNTPLAVIRRSGAY